MKISFITSQSVKRIPFNRDPLTDCIFRRLEDDSQLHIHQLQHHTRT